MTRKELISSPEYWIAQAQIQIFEEVKKALKNTTEEVFCQSAKISAYKLKQIMDGDWRGTMVEYVKVLVACGKVPKIKIKKLKKQK